MAWKKFSSKQVFKNRYMEVTEEHLETDSGLELLRFGVVHKEPAALIIPWDGERLTLVGQYRYPVDSFVWHFPQGHFEHDTVYATAKEELEEETGLKAGRIVEIGTFYLAPQHHTQVYHLFFATELSSGNIARDAGEADMQAKSTTLEDFIKLVADGEIKDGPTLAAFAIAREKGLL